MTIFLEGTGVCSIKTEGLLRISGESVNLPSSCPPCSFKTAQLTFPDTTSTGDLAFLCVGYERSENQRQHG